MMSTYNQNIGVIDKSNYLGIISGRTECWNKQDGSTNITGNQSGIDSFNVLLEFLIQKYGH
jgi:hypothetical protein